MKLRNGLPVLDTSRQLGSEAETRFTEALDILKNAAQFKHSATPKLKQAHPYFPGSYLVKLFLPRGRVGSGSALFSVQPWAGRLASLDLRILINQRGQKLGSLGGCGEGCDGLMNVTSLGSI